MAQRLANASDGILRLSSFSWLGPFVHQGPKSGRTMTSEVMVGGVDEGTDQMG
jgi:hypothetical protein